MPDDYGYAADYEYNPRPPPVKPPISPDTFAALLGACDRLCSWSFLPIWMHKCHHIRADSRCLVRIPQKKSAYLTGTLAHVSQGNFAEPVAFGIQANYMLSFARVFTYHIIPILGGFAFWIWWLRHYPSDLQNASVPLFTIGMLLGTSWALIGRYTDKS